MKQLISSEGKDYTTNNMIADVILVMLKYHIARAGGQNLEIEVGTFDNCREYGNTYRMLNSEQDYTFCVYEHRNSDQIIINGCPTSEMKPYGAYCDGSKWDYYFSGSYDEHYRVAFELWEMMIDCKNGRFFDKFNK